MKFSLPNTTRKCNSCNLIRVTLIIRNQYTFSSITQYIVRMSANTQLITPAINENYTLRGINFGKETTVAI